MAMACGSRLASSLLQDSFSSLALSEAGRGDGRRVSSSQLCQGAGGLRRSCRVPTLLVSEESSSFSQNLTCNARGSKLQHLNAVADALNQTRAILRAIGKGELRPFGNLEVNPAAGVLNYGQGVFEGLKAYKTVDNRVLMFRPEENALRLIHSAERMSMPAPDVETFVNAVKQTVIANKRWIPPAGKGSLYIRPLLIGTGPILGLAPAPEYTFLIYVSPVGAYFKVLKTQLKAKGIGYSDVLYLDAVEKKYVEEVSSCNIFMIKDNVISTPELAGTILPGITRKSIIELSRSRGYKVNERPVSVDELLDADEVFCTGTAVVLNPVGSITHGTRRVQYNNGAVGGVSQELYEALTSLQMGLSNDGFGWVVELA